MFGEELTLPIDDTTLPEYRVCADLYQRVLQHAIVDPSQYTGLFSDALTEKAIGEATTSNLYFPKAAENIRHFIPDAKLIAILRNPVDRAFSGYLHAVRVGHEQRDFKEALVQEPIDSSCIWWGTGDYYIRPGFYSTQLTRYFDRFDRKQIKVYLYDDLANNPQALMRDLFHFLDVDDTFQIDLSRKHNVSSVASDLSSSFFRVVHRIATFSKPMRAVTDTVKRSLPTHLRKRLDQSHRSVRLRNQLRNADLTMGTELVGNGNNSFRKPTLDPQTRRWLADIYREDILKLQQMLQCDLSAWLREGESASKTT